jgi:hypothetical protein
MVSCLTCVINQSRTVAGKLYLGNLLNSTGKGVGMVFTQECGKIWRRQFPLFSRMGRCRRLSHHFTESRFGVGPHAGKDLGVLHVHTYMHSMDPCVIQKS